jgi:hypothetical protein
MSDGARNLVRKGARFRVTRDLRRVGGSTWRAPFTGDFEATIPAGTILVADYGQREGAPGFAVVPEEYGQLEAQLVPDETRLAEKYSGYYFVFRTSDIGDALEPLP